MVSTVFSPSFGTKIAQYISPTLQYDIYPLRRRYFPRGTGPSRKFVKNSILYFLFMHQIHTPPSSEISDITPRKKWKSTFQHLVKELLCDRKSQKTNNRLRSQFILQKISLLESVQDTGMIPERQKDFFMNHS